MYHGCSLTQLVAIQQAVLRRVVCTGNEVHSITWYYRNCVLTVGSFILQTHSRVVQLTLCLILLLLLLPGLEKNKSFISMKDSYIETKSFHLVMHEKDKFLPVAKLSFHIPVPIFPRKEPPSFLVFSTHGCYCYNFNYYHCYYSN